MLSWELIIFGHWELICCNGKFVLLSNILAAVIVFLAAVIGFLGAVMGTHTLWALGTLMLWGLGTHILWALGTHMLLGSGNSFSL